MVRPINQRPKDRLKSQRTILCRSLCTGSKVPDAYSGNPMYCILQGIQVEVGHDLIDRVYCTNTSMPGHEAVPLSHKTCLQIEAATFI